MGNTGLQQIIRIISLVGLILIGKGSGALQAGQIIQTPDLTITINDATGYVGRIFAGNQREDTSQNADLLVDSNLLSLDW